MSSSSTTFAERLTTESASGCEATGSWCGPQVAFLAENLSLFVLFDLRFVFGLKLARLLLKFVTVIDVVKDVQLWLDS